MSCGASFRESSREGEASVARLCPASLVVFDVGPRRVLESLVRTLLRGAPDKIVP